jgi:hypothetical protein
MKNAPVSMRMLLMPAIKPIEMNAPRQAASASASSERCWGRRLGCRIKIDPYATHRADDGIALSSNASYQQLQASSLVNHKKIRH